MKQQRSSQRFIVSVFDVGIGKAKRYVMSAPDLATARADVRAAGLPAARVQAAGVFYARRVGLAAVLLAVAATGAFMVKSQLMPAPASARATTAATESAERPLQPMWDTATNATDRRGAPWMMPVVVGEARETGTPE